MSICYTVQPYFVIFLLEEALFLKHIILEHVVYIYSNLLNLGPLIPLFIYFFFSIPLIITLDKIELKL